MSTSQTVVTIKVQEAVPEPERASILARALPWITNSGLAILDQGLISGSNFVVSILLARWMTPEQYGAYAVAFGLFILLSLIYLALVLEPMAVFGGSSYSRSLREYLDVLLRLHAAVTIGIVFLLGLGVIAVFLVRGPGPLVGALTGVTIASPCLFLFWLARRTYYLELSPVRAVRGAFLYCCLLLGGLYLLDARGLLTPFAAFLLIAVASLLTSLLLFYHLRSALPSSGLRLKTSEIWRRHWTYGRWALATSVASWIPAYIYYPILSTFGSMPQSGQLRAVMNFANPMEQTQMALAMLFLPYAARVQGVGSSRNTNSWLCLKLTFISLGVTAAYWTVVSTIRQPLFHFLYSGRYMDVTSLIPVVAIGSLFWSAAYGSAIVLRAMESPSLIFVAYLAAAVASLLVGIPAAVKFGVVGGIWGINVSDAVSFGALVFLLRNRINMVSDPAS